MSSALWLGTTMIVVTVAVHVGGLVLLSATLTAMAPHFDPLSRAVKAFLLLVLSVLAVLALHVLEAWGWALVYLNLGEFTSLETALYFSAVTATTLGYGDLTLSQDWRLLGAFEAMAGLILFAASTAFLLALSRSVFETSPKE